MNWGKSIVLAYVLFFVFIAIIVMKAMREDISLVSDHYYDDELKYESTIIAKRNFNNLIDKPVYYLNNNVFTIDFNIEIDSATISFYKPDNKKNDFKAITKQQISSYNFKQKPSGLWKVKTTFYSNNNVYYYDLNFNN